MTWLRLLWIGLFDNQYLNLIRTLNENTILFVRIGTGANSFGVNVGIFADCSAGLFDKSKDFAVIYNLNKCF